MIEKEQIDLSQAKKLLDHARTHYFHHVYLIKDVFMRKRQERSKPLTLYVHQPTIAPALESAKEIIDLEPEKAENEGEGEEEGEQENSDFESEVDPDDPLYGLKERLAVLEFDDETKNMIKTKLKETNEKMKKQLEDRQQNLDQRISSMTGKK